MASAQAPANAGSPLGTNTGFIRDWSTEWPFVDAFKTSRAWLTQCVPGQQADCTYANAHDTRESALLDLDADGYPRRLPLPGESPTFWRVGTLMFRDIGTRYPAGRYVVLYDGQGTLAYSSAAVLVSSSPGRDLIDVTPQSNGIALQIATTDPAGTGNHIRNIRVIMPGFEATHVSEPFHPAFLERFERYRAIRYMDWMNTNGSTQRTWAGRPLPSHARYSGNTGGAPVEHMIGLSNRLGALPWFTLPHLADDDYMTQFAIMVRDGLRSDLQVYVEYSNEVWNTNTAFTQGTYAEQQGVALWPDPSTSAYSKRLQWYGMRSAQLCDIWKGVFGSQADRVICVLGTQSQSTSSARQSLDCPLWTAGAPCSAHGIGSIAIAPYFGNYIGAPVNQTTLRSWTSDPDGGLGRLFGELENGGQLVGSPTGGAVAETYTWMSAFASLASTRGLTLTAYEGGQHLVGYNGVENDAAITNLFIAANRDARMGVLYDRYLAAWRDRGGELMMHYNNVRIADRYGSWGALEYLDQSSSPKYDALMRFITENPCWYCTAGCGNGVVDQGEACDPNAPGGGGCCTYACQLQSAGSTCRAAAGVCDVGEVCDGVTAACPADQRAPSTTMCRASNACNTVTEYCSGTGVDCPADQGQVSCAHLDTACRVASCDPATGCRTTSTNEGGSCNDGNASTINDRCTAGLCAGVAPDLVLFSFTNSPVTVGGVTGADEDVYELERTAGTWRRSFIGAQRGLPAGADIDALYVDASGRIIVSFDTSVTIAGMTGGVTTAAPEDLVMWNPSTATWSFYFDGSDVGLTQSAEDIDAVHVLADGRIVLSTSGNVSVTGASGDHADLLAFRPTTLGSVTVGTWAVYFDGSDVGLTQNNEDVDGLSILSDGSLLVSMLGAGGVTGVATFGGDDVLRFVPSTLGANTAGTWSMWLSAASSGATGGVDAIHR